MAHAVQKEHVVRLVEPVKNGRAAGAAANHEWRTRGAAVLLIQINCAVGIEHPRVHPDFVPCTEGWIFLNHRLERVERRGGAKAGVGPGTGGAAPGVVGSAAVVQIDGLGSGALNLKYRVGGVGDRRLVHAGHADEIVDAGRECRDIPAVESVGAVHRVGARRSGPTTAAV